MRKGIAILMAVSLIAVALLGSACSDLSFLLSHGIVVTDLTISPNPAEVGQTVTVTATVTNEGDEEGDFYTPLMVDGDAADMELVTLAAGASETVTFSAVMNFGGTYEISIGDQEVTLVITASEMQNILKMVPADWNAFLYFGAKTMRSDTATLPDKGLADLWDIFDEYLDFFADAASLDVTLPYPDGDLPFTTEQLDYLAFGIGGLETMDFDEDGALPNMTLMAGGSFTAAQVSSFLDNFATNWPDANMSFVSGTYNTVDTWTPTPASPDPNFPDLLFAVVEGSTNILFGPAGDVEACIDVIKTEGDDDSMFENDNIRGVIGDFGNPVLMAVIDGNVPLPVGEEGGDGPTLPDNVEITAGIAMEKTGDTMRLQAILEIGEMGDWLALLTDAIPTPTEMQEQQEAREEEREREDEYWNIQNSVYNLMGDNWLPDGTLPHPVTTTATQDMSAFPDATSVAGSADKQWANEGSAYQAGDAPGYVLWHHDGTANNDAAGEWDYVGSQHTTTQYYYTCDADGTLHQWSDAVKTMEYEYERDWEEPET